MMHHDFSLHVKNTFVEVKEESGHRSRSASWPPSQQHLARTAAPAAAAGGEADGAEVDIDMGAHSGFSFTFVHTVQAPAREAVPRPKKALQTGELGMGLHVGLSPVPDTQEHLCHGAGAGSPFYGHCVPPAAQHHCWAQGGAWPPPPAGITEAYYHHALACHPWHAEPHHLHYLDQQPHFWPAAPHDHCLHQQQLAALQAAADLEQQAAAFWAGALACPQHPALVAPELGMVEPAPEEEPSPNPSPPPSSRRAAESLAAAPGAPCSAENSQAARPSPPPPPLFPIEPSKIGGATGAAELSGGSPSTGSPAASAADPPAPATPPRRPSCTAQPDGAETPKKSRSAIRRGKRAAAAQDPIAVPPGLAAVAEKQPLEATQGEDRAERHPVPPPGLVPAPRIALPFRKPVPVPVMRRQARRHQRQYYEGGGLAPHVALPHRRWCCFYLRMGSTKGFELVPIIIGRQGCHTRTIAEETGAKIRVRGKGSGHLEVATGREAPTPLMLVVATEFDNMEGFHNAVWLSFKLLQEVEVRYQNYCHRYGCQPVEPAFVFGPMKDDLYAELQGVLGDDCPPRHDSRAGGADRDDMESLLG